MNLATIQHHSYMKSAVVDVGVQVGSPLRFDCDVSIGVQAGTPLAPVIEYMSSAPVIGCLAPAPAVFCSSSGLVDPLFSLTAHETSHVAPAVSLSVPSQQLPVVYIKTTVTTDDLEEFTEPVYDQVHQEQIAASEMPENIAEIPVVHEQVIVGLRPERLVDARPQGGLERAACSRFEAPLLSPVVMVLEAAHDDITAAFLLTQSLRQRQEEVEDAAMGREEDVEEDDRLVEYF